MARLAQRVVLRALFSEDLEDIDELAAAVDTRRRYMEYIFFSVIPFPEYLPTRINLEYRHAIKRIDAFLYGWIAKRRRIADPPHDLLTMLMTAPYKDSTFMNDKQVRDEALTISVTGHETVGEALSSCRRVPRPVPIKVGVSFAPR
jgi:cytochrome P450